MLTIPRSYDDASKICRRYTTDPDQAEANIPDELQRLGCVNFKLETRDNGKMAKIPHSPVTGKRGKKYGSFAQALERVRSGEFDGVGFPTGNGIAFVDFDNCVKNGVIDPVVWDWIRRFNSYASITPSGSGVRIWGHGAVEMLTP